MKKNVTFLFLLISIICNAQNSIIQNNTTSETKNDSIFICPFPNNCGYYKGYVINGKANGQGKAILKAGIEEGERKDNRLNGQGTLTLANGTKFIGEFEDGLM